MSALDVLSLGRVRGGMSPAWGVGVGCWPEGSALCLAREGAEVGCLPGRQGESTAPSRDFLWPGSSACNKPKCLPNRFDVSKPGRGSFPGLIRVPLPSPGSPDLI